MPPSRSAIPTGAVHAEAIAAIYQTVQQPGRLQDALARIGSALGADVVHLVDWDTRANVALSATISCPQLDLASESYARHYGRIDPRRLALSERAPERFYRCHQHLNERFVRRNEFFQDYLIPLGLRWVSATRFVVTEGCDTLFALCGRIGARPLDDRSIAQAGDFVTHLRRATQMRAQLARPDDLLLNAEDVLRALPGGALLVDPSGRCHGCNAAARTALTELRLTLKGSALLFPHPGQQARWSTELRTVFQTGLPMTLAMATGGSQTWRIHLTPIRAITPNHPGIESRLILVALERDLPSVAQTAQAFAARHHLTPAEAAVLLGLCAGKSTGAIAAERASALATVRKQLATIFAKTGLASQVELVVAATRSQGPT